MTLQEQFNKYLDDDELNEAMELLKDHPGEIDPSDRNNYAVHKAVEMEHADFAELLYLDDRIIFEELSVFVGFHILRLIEIKVLKKEEERTGKPIAVSGCGFNTCCLMNCA